MLCPFQRMLCVFVGMLCAFFSMLRALVAVHRGLVGRPRLQRGTLSLLLTTPRQSRGRGSLLLTTPRQSRGRGSLVLTTPRRGRGRAVPFSEHRDPLAAVPSGLREARRVLRGAPSAFTRRSPPRGPGSMGEVPHAEGLSGVGPRRVRV